MSEFEPLTDLFVPELIDVYDIDYVGNPSPKDQAELIALVYTNLGIFRPDMAEKAPELITPQIEALYQTHPDTALEPFVTFNLRSASEFRALLRNFDKGQPGKRQTTLYDKLWDKYDLDELNSCRTDGQAEPTIGLIRGHVLSAPENDYNELGLIGTNKTLAEQRQLAIGQTLLNITEYTAIQAMRRETGQRLDQQPLDTQTYTRFPQLKDRSLYGFSCVGFADWRYDQLYLDGSRVDAGQAGGVRISLGLENQQQK